MSIEHNGGDRSASRPPEMVALANWLVGPFSHDQRQDPATQELQPWQVPYYDVAVNGLRRIAGIAEDQDLPPNFQPDPLQGVELYRELSGDRKAHTMISSLQTYIRDYKSGNLPTGLRPHQQEIMDVLSEEVAKVGMDRQITIKSPTGTGKTAIFTTLIEALKYKEQPADKVRALVLLPSKDILSQTVAAFDQFTDIEATKYYGEEKRIGDVTAMTYQSFKKALDRGDIDKSSFDVVVRDEADTFAKGAIGKRIDDYCSDPETGRNKLVVGLTATPHESLKLSYQRTLVESIGDTLNAPLVTYQRNTGAVVKEGDDRDWRVDFKDTEVRHLMNDRDRNQIIVEEIITGLKSGRRVMARCIPGQELAHPKMIRDMLLKVGRIAVCHPYVGDIEKRTIRPVIIPGTMPMKQREILTRVFNNELDENIDVLLFVGTLIRGFDSPVAKKVINGAPTRSPALVEQLLGRVERLFQAQNGNHIHAQAVDVVDRTDSELVTFEDIINRDAPPGMRYRHGAIIGPQLADLNRNDWRTNSAFEPIPPEEVAGAITNLTTRGVEDFGELDLRRAETESLSPESVTTVINAAALLKTAKVISERRSRSGGHIPLEVAAARMHTSPVELMATAHRMRVAIEAAYAGGSVNHFFSEKALHRIEEYRANQVSN